MSLSGYNSGSSYWRNNPVNQTNRKISFKKYIVMLPLFGLSVLSPINTHDPNAMHTNSGYSKVEESLECKLNRISVGGVSRYGLTEKVKDKIQRIIKNEDAKIELEEALSNLSAFDEYFEKASKDYNLDINFIKAYVAKESNGNPHAQSNKGAVGLGGMMELAAKEANLRVDEHIDERVDPKSIVGSAKYMKDCIGRFNDFVVGMIAYNVGPTWTYNNIKVVLNGSDIVMNKSIPFESRNYILEVLARAEIFSRPEFYGLNFVRKNPISNIRSEEFVITKRTTMNNLAKIHRVKLDELKKVNPSIKTELIPQGTKVHIPKKDVRT
jgi:hypothetical protein